MLLAKWRVGGNMHWTQRLEVREKISNTLKARGIKPKIRYDATGDKRTGLALKNIQEGILRAYPPVYMTCMVCNSSFRISPRRRNIAKYCSRACHNKGQTFRTEEEKRRQDVVQTEKRRGLKLKAGFFTKEEWENLLRKNAYTCLSCGRHKDEILIVADHIVPLSRGGSNTIENIQPLCRSCNAHKYTKTYKYASYTEPRVWG